MGNRRHQAPANARRLRALVTATALALGSTLGPISTATSARERHATVRFVYSPYKDVTLSFNSTTHEIASAASGGLSPLVVNGRSALPVGVKALTWAFAIGECGAETLGGLDAQKVADANVAAFDRAGIDYIISTGGQGGVFTCGSDAGMEAFIARYASPRLVGIDLDIEAKQTPEIVDALIRRVIVAQRKHPALRFSFTLPTLAASDGSKNGLNAQGRDVLEAIRRHGLADFTINLMVMDYGPPSAANCVVGAGVCDMARSAIQAAENLHGMHGVPYRQIELTAMIGVNDVAANDFHPADAEVIARYARKQGLAGIHFWSMDRDTPCPRPATGASPACSGMPGVPARAFGAAFDKGLR